MELVLIKSLARLGAATKKIPFLARKMLTDSNYQLAAPKTPPENRKKNEGPNQIKQQQQNETKM